MESEIQIAAVGLLLVTGIFVAFWNSRWVFGVLSTDKRLSGRQQRDEVDELARAMSTARARKPELRCVR
jgi:hypothetical protein